MMEQEATMQDVKDAAQTLGENVMSKSLVKYSQAEIEDLARVGLGMEAVYIQSQQLSELPLGDALNDKTNPVVKEFITGSIAIFYAMENILNARIEKRIKRMEAGEPSCNPNNQN